MRHLIRMLILFYLFCTGTALSAQTTITSSGGVASGIGGTVSYSAGQIVYTKIEDSTGSLIQGVQQPFEISVITSIKEAAGISLAFSVYPNPATDFIRLKITNSEMKNMIYQLYDISGNILLSNRIEGTETIITMQNFLPGNYFLRISGGSTELKTFKIIKR